jgi:hypothetical protein
MKNNLLEEIETIIKSDSTKVKLVKKNFDNLKKL